MEENIKIDTASQTHRMPFLERSLFANWISVAPQSQQTVKLTYEPSLTIKPTTSGQSGKGYTLVLQKQPGASPTDYQLTIRYPENWHVAWQGGAELTNADQTLTWQGELTKDEIFGMLFAH